MFSVASLWTLDLRVKGLGFDSCLDHGDFKTTSHICDSLHPMGRKKLVLGGKPAMDYCSILGE